MAISRNFAPGVLLYSRFQLSSAIGDGGNSDSGSCILVAGASATSYNQTAGDSTRCDLGSVLLRHSMVAAYSRHHPGVALIVSFTTDDSRGTATHLWLWCRLLFLLLVCRSRRCCSRSLLQNKPKTAVLLPKP